MATKGDDCYFYYNTECLKGDQCPFRHGQAALGNNTVCTLWLQGSYFRSACPFRHMHITPLKSELSCCFEIQPSGCLKPNCPFKHFKLRNVSTLGTSSMLVMSTTQPVVAVRPSVRASTNLVQAQDKETPNFLGVVKEGMTSLSAQSDNKGTSNLTVSGQIVTPTKPIDFLYTTRCAESLQ
ncbi:zinc finger CCCH domain-containing protein 11A-like isoform X2 [Corticium candelabrum]|uniref:zinc finger CCCH domain-containing protein 11A-like isoform X2 n=1 Tax=Corticium candelabrum TaxID=121492 RepID=UPI002E255077|nr:zinc finger CCCH domain-containing protein 11A-like isoform X2 [Corticium candelabrum]